LSIAAGWGGWLVLGLRVEVFFVIAFFAAVFLIEVFFVAIVKLLSAYADLLFFRERGVCP
jgi:hypothetical protein